MHNLVVFSPEEYHLRVNIAVVSASTTSSELLLKGYYMDKLKALHVPKPLGILHANLSE